MALGQSSVNISSVANFHDVNQEVLVVDEIYDAIVTLSYPVSVELSR
jgi:hypoxanthine phosphoribosyltransferase